MQMNKFAEINQFVNEGIMKARMVFLMVMLTGMSAALWAQAARSFLSHGAHWARLDDRAQIELLTDELRTAARQNRLSEVLQKRAVRHFMAAESGQLAVLAQQLCAPVAEKTDVIVEGNRAVLTWPGGGRLCLRKVAGQWQLDALNAAAPAEAPGAELPGESSLPLREQGLSAGRTLETVPLSADQRIDRLTRTVAQRRLERRLFGAPEKTASYYHARYTDRPPFVEAVFVQFVLDPAWNRIVYGRLEHWIKSYNDVTGPSAIAVDAAGRVFVGESGRQRILVLQLQPEAESSTLQLLFTLESAGVPLDLALDDAGTPLDTSDDVLCVANGRDGNIVKYALSEHGAVKVAEFAGFDSPSAVATGRWNGASSGMIYVIDRAGTRLRQFRDDRTALQPLGEVRARPGEYFSALKCDHFGNLFVADALGNRVHKFSADLEWLDSSDGTAGFRGLLHLDIPFGKIEVPGEGTFWGGFDQMFTLERWSESSGALRHQLGVAIRNARFSPAADAPEVISRFVLTDHARVSARIFDERGLQVRELPGTWLNSGQKALRWDRRDAQGSQLPGGTYQMEIAAATPYREAPVTLSAEFYLPLFYQVICGSDRPGEDAFRVRGISRTLPGAPHMTVAEDPDAVVYRFPGLNPQGKYALNVESRSPDGAGRTLRIAGGKAALTILNAGSAAVQTGWIPLPDASYREGDFTLRIEKVSGGSATVSRIWLKETGRDFRVTGAGSQDHFPQDFVLESNFPNPFNPSTSIRFRLLRESRVTLEIFNVLGQRVRVLLDRALPGGIHEVVWDGKSDTGAAVGSGFYFYRLRAGDFSQTRRMLLMK